MFLWPGGGGEGAGEGKRLGAKYLTSKFVMTNLLVKSGKGKFEAFFRPEGG